MDARELPPRPNMQQYRKQARELLRGWDAADPAALRRIRQSHPRFRRVPESEARGRPFALADAQLTLAREHGFESWPKFSKHSEALVTANSPVSRFESAVDAAVTGDVATLERLLRDDPGLARARSTREHRATLLHYVAANGVEDYRQKSPKNAVLVARALLEAGAMVDALAATYAGGTLQTTLNLLVSSVHPALAGVQGALVETLLEFGAAIDGVAGDGSPLLTALAFHHADAAELLAARGARVDTVVAAAGLGYEDLVGQLVQDGATLRPGARLVDVAWVNVAKEPRANVELALVWAASHGRAHVVELLLGKGVDPGATDARRWTGLHRAAYHGHLRAVQALLRGKAPLEVTNEYGGTPLDQAVWATVHERLLPEHVAIIESLIDAGASVDAGWLTPHLDPPLDERVATALRRGCS